MGVNVGATPFDQAKSAKKPGGLDSDTASMYVPVTQDIVNNLINEVEQGKGRKH